MTELVPTDVLEALGQLNGHARAFGNGKKAIYAYKTLATAVLAASHQLQAVSLVEWRGKCRDCGGTGRFQHWDGDRADHCWRCSNSGTARLKFVETTLANGQSWHHPFDHAGSPGRTIAEIAGVLRWDSAKGRYIYTHEGVEYPEAVWFPVVHWAPGQQATRLPADDTARLLNIVEGWLEGRHFVDPCYWPAETARREMRGYTLDIGRAGEVCWYCGSSDVSIGLGRPGPPFEWSAPVCLEHSKMPIDQWPEKTALPEALITPALAEWRDRHQRIGFEREVIFA